MYVLFLESPPTLDWTSESNITKAGRRWPSFSITGETTYNYFNLSAAAVLQEHKHRCVYLDAQVSGFSVPDTISEINKQHPEVIVVYVDQINLKVDYAIIEKVKAESNPLVIFVGPFVTPLDREVLADFPQVDVIVRGEFDYVVDQIVQAYSRKKSFDEIQGVSFLKDDKAVRSGPDQHVQDVDSLPIPAYDLIDLHKYKDSANTRLPVGNMSTSRGCPYQCTYCWFPQTMLNHQWRAMSPERVMREIKFLVDNYQVQEIEFDDDLFEMDRDRVIEICRRIKEAGYTFSWSPQCRPDLVDEELLRIMKDAGCSRILYGCESGNQETLDNIKKGFTLEDSRKAVRLTRKVGIDILNCFMIGFAWETEEMVQKTIDFACELNAEFTQFGIPTPLPGTAYYKYVKEKGYLITDDWSKFSGFSQAVVSYPHLKRETLEKYEVAAYRRYYLRPAYVTRMLVRAFKTVDNFKQTFKLAVAFWKRKREGWI